MTKIIKSGRPQSKGPDVDTQQWVDKRVTCGNCGCVFETEVDDSFDVVTTIDKPDVVHSVYIQCPTCSEPWPIYIGPGLGER